MSILYIIFTVIISVIVTYLILRPKIRLSKKLDTETQQINLDLKNTNNKLLLEHSSLKEHINSLCLDKIRLQSEISGLNEQIKQMEENSELVYQANLKAAEEKLNNQLNLKKQEIIEAENEYTNEYKNVLQECSQDFLLQLNSLIQQREQREKELQVVNSQIDDRKNFNRL